MTRWSQLAGSGPVRALLGVLAVAVVVVLARATLGAREEPPGPLLPMAGPAASGGPLRIMPLGDSLTDGETVPGGYRVELWSRLMADNLNVDFVGSQVNGPPELRDRDHEGHSGWRIDQIAGSAGLWLRTYKPQIVLLLIGTNDMSQDFDVGGAPARLSALLDQIHQEAPDAAMVLASLPRVADPAVTQRIQTYNDAIPGITSSKGWLINYVDLFGAIQSADLHPDGVHLTAEGYAKMANVWYSALQPLVRRDPSPTPARP